MPKEKSIFTLVDDIQELFVSGKECDVDNANALGRAITDTILRRLSDIKAQHEGTADKRSGIRLSSIRNPCTRQLWFREHDDKGGENLTPATQLKFLYGDVLEELLLFLAKEAGHRVEGQQDTLVLSGIEGHRDAVIDGVTIDCKSASTFSFTKFDKGLNTENDSFGYLGQLGNYVLAGKDDPLVEDKDGGAFLAVDKQHGHLTLDYHTFNFDGWEHAVEETKQEVANPEVMPERGFEPVPEGKSGNMKLPTNCSYCSEKFKCHENVRTFIYSKGPTYLTTVEREPNVPEAQNEAN